MLCDDGWSDYMCHVMMGGVTRCDNGWSDSPPKWNTGNITEDWYSMGKRETYIVCLTIGSYP